MSWRTKPSLPGTGHADLCREADVVVVGLGYSGTAAARAAAEEGASVIGLEAMTPETFNSYGRDIGHINSAFLRSRGIPEVAPTDLFNEWMRRAGNRANPRLVMQFCRNSGDTFDWFTDMYGIEGLRDVHIAFTPKGGERFKAASGEEAAVNGYHFWYGTAEFPDPMGWPGGPTLTDLVRANHAAAERHGAQLFFGTEALQLQTEDGRVTGVWARDGEGRLCLFSAKRNVILAAGDFSRDDEMMRDLCCDLSDVLLPDQPLPARAGRTGAGVRMGVWAGGRLESRPLPTMGGNYLDFSGPCTFGSVWLDSRGRRFCNEVFGGTELRGFAGSQAGIDTVYCVFDEHMLENELQWAVPAHGSFDENTAGAAENLQLLAADRTATQIELQLPPPMRKKLVVYAGDTPEELTANAHLSGALAERIAESIRRYNRMCAEKLDSDFGRDPKLLDPLTDRLFLQIAQPQAMMLVTVGGLVTDENQRVLDENYRRIPGLVATGNCCGRRFGTQYATPISGVSIGMAMTLGREAGKVAVGHLPAE